MNGCKIRTLALGVLGLGLAIATVSQCQPAIATEDDRRIAAQNAIIRLGDNLDAQDLAEQARKIVKEHVSQDISSVFRMRHKGGLGIGKLTEIEKTGDGIERLMMKLSRRKTITEAEIDKYGEDYLRVAKVLQAMAELAPHRASERVRKDSKLTREWQEVTHEFKEGAATFRKAIEERDPKKLRIAASQMNNTCCHCHDLSDR